MTVLDPASISAGVTSIKAAIEITKTLSDARDASKLLAVKLELQGLLLEAQEAQSALAAEKRELEERVRQLEAWDGEKKRYELTDVGRGAVAFTLKAGAEGSETPHQLCTACFGEGHKGYLQPERRTPGLDRYLVCHRCSAEIALDNVHPEHRGAKPRKPPPAKRGYSGGF